MDQCYYAQMTNLIERTILKKDIANAYNEAGNIDKELNGNQNYYGFKI